MLLHLRDVVAHQIHAGAVAAVLGTGGEHLRQHLGRVAVGQPLHDPHVRLVQAVAAGARVVGPVGAAVLEGGQHVPANRAVPQVVQVHGVQHLRRDEQGHRRPLALVPVDAGQERVREELAEGLPQLSQVLDGVTPLPECALPVRLGDRAVARNPGPVGLPELALERIHEGLRGGRGHRGTASHGPAGLAARGHGRIQGLHVHVMSGPTTEPEAQGRRRPSRCGAPLGEPTGQFPHPGEGSPSGAEAPRIQARARMCAPSTRLNP